MRFKNLLRPAAGIGTVCLLTAILTVSAYAAYPSSGTDIPAGSQLLTGDVIGEVNGWDGSPGTGAASAFDGNAYSYYDPTAQGQEYTYCGMDFGSPAVLTKVMILPREGWTDRFDGGSIQGSNDMEDWVTLYTSDSAARNWDWQEITDFDTGEAFRFYRYWNGKNHGDVGEIEFYGRFSDAAYVGPVLLSGEVIGEDHGWDGSPEKGAAAAFDGDRYTYYDPTIRSNENAYAGLDLGQQFILTKIRILPRENWLDRFRGGSIQGSNDLKDWETLWVSTHAASSWDWQTAEEFDENTGYRYYRYWNGEEHGDVAEVQLYGYPLDGNYTPPTPATLAVPAEAVTVSFDIRRDTITADAAPLSVQPGDVYPALPGSPVSSFIGWFTLPEGGDQVKEGDTVTRLTSHTLYARYEGEEAALEQVSAEAPVSENPAPADPVPTDPGQADAPAAEASSAETAAEESGFRPLPAVCIGICALAVAVTCVVMAKKKD